MPHSKFWMASANANTSRPQWLACDIGVRKKPSEERGPKLIIAIRQPQMITTKGVRQPTRPPVSPAADCTDIAGISPAELNRRAEPDYRACRASQNEFS